MRASYIRHQKIISMNASHILRADLLDIIFENRNKAYGAYALRKFYDQQVVKSLGLVFIAMAAFSYIFYTTKHPVVLITRSIPPHGPTSIITEIAVVKPHKKSSAKKPETKFSSKIVFVDSLPLDDVIVEAPDRVAISGVGVQPGPPVEVSAGIGDGNAREIVPPVPAVPPLPDFDASKPLEKADIDPTYPGGLKALNKFLVRNLQNPEEIEAGTSVSVKIKFVVGYDGVLKAFEIKEDGGEVYNKEVIRVLKKMPRWIPGKNNGQNVSVYFIIPVRFINGQ